MKQPDEFEECELNCTKLKNALLRGEDIFLTRTAKRVKVLDCQLVKPGNTGKYFHSKFKRPYVEVICDDRKPHGYYSSVFYKFVGI